MTPAQTPEMTPEMSLREKVAVITGGTQGLGAATARLFARRGARAIVLCGRNAEKGIAVARELEEGAQCSALFVECDLAKLDECRNVIARTDEHFKRVDILVNAAGITDRGSILDSTPELFDKILAVNLRAPFFLMQDAAKVMRREQRPGAIVNVASMSSYCGQSFLAPYSTSKGALVTLTRNAAFALMRDRIRVNALNLGWMETEGEDVIQKKYHAAADDWAEQAAKNLPFKRLISPQEAARAIAFLSSDESGLMTGAAVNYDQSVWGGYDSPPLPPDSLQSAR